MKFFFFIFLTSCQLHNGSRKELGPEINVLDKLANIFSIEIYDAYIRTCETLINKKRLDKANIKNCQLALKNKKPKLKEVKKFFLENFSFDKDQLTMNNGIMTGYYEPEIKAYKYQKKNSYPIYKMDINKYGETIFKSTRKEINKGLLKNKG